MRKIKKVISLLLILILIGVNFIPLINVKAEGTTIITNDNNCNSKGCYVTNKAGITVTNVEDSNDIFSLYKVLDTYYNSTTNEFSYEFTSDFVNFKNDSNYSNYVISEGKTIGGLTIDDYFDLTSDSAGYSGVRSSSTLNKLVSKYAVYIRENEITGIEMTTSGNVASLNNVESGAYLVFNTTTSVKVLYGVMVGNLIFTENGNEWVLNNLEIVAKNSCVSSHEMHFISDVAIKVVENSALDSLMEIISSDLVTEKDISTNKNFIYGYVIDNVAYPTNAINKDRLVEIEFDKGISIDNIILTDGEGTVLSTDSDNNIFDSAGTKFASFTIDEQKFIISLSELGSYEAIFVLCNVKLSDQAVVGSDGNKITTSHTYSVSPYEPSRDLAYKTDNFSATAYTYGIKLRNNKRNDNSTLLKGASYEVYSNSDLGEDSLVGSFTVSDDGFGKFKGVVEGTYYLKQTKAPTGYKLSNNSPVEVIVGTLGEMSDEDGYYLAISENDPLGFLPSTGGIGTVIYTFIGLLIIVVGSIAFISYRKKNVKI